ncbi:MAG: S1C family serine protease [Anaerolineae bacterium]
MGANEKPQVHVDIKLSCDTCAEEIQACVAEGVGPEQLRDESPALWEHIRACPTCAETFLALVRAIQAFSDEDIPCEICAGQMEDAAEQDLSHAEAREAFPATWKHVEMCPVCAPHYSELLHLIHDEGYLEAHHEERALRRTVTGIAALALVLIVLLTLGALRWGRVNEEAVVSRIYRQSGPAIVRIAAVGRTGSGMIFDGEGHILTNNHVVEGATRISVRLVDGATVDARLVGRDLATDLAVLQVDLAGHPTSIVHFGNSDKLKVGDLAVVIGNPFDLERSLSVGHISALNRILSTKDPYGAEIYGGIQTDAAINPGNSGGPLFNSAGQVVGITTAIVPGPSGGSVGLGFAVPINTARRIIHEMLVRGYVSRPYLGVIGRPLMAFEATRLGLPVNRGLVVSRVDPGSPADEIGLRAGTGSIRAIEPNIGIDDVIVALDGQPVESMPELWRLLQQHAVGDEVVLTVLHAGRELKLTAELQEQPRPD